MVDDAGYIAVAEKQASNIILMGSIDAAIIAAQALYSRLASQSINDKQIEIANAQVKIAEAIERHIESFWDKENNYLDTVFKEPYHDLTYNYPTQWSPIAESSIRDNMSGLQKTLQKHCKVPNQCEQNRYLSEGAKLGADVYSYAARQEEARQNANNDRRFSRQYHALGLGRGLMGQLSSYGGVASQAGYASGQSYDFMINQGESLYGSFFGQVAVPNWAYLQPRSNSPFAFKGQMPNANMPTAGPIRQNYTAPVIPVKQEPLPPL